MVGSADDMTGSTGDNGAGLPDEVSKLREKRLVDGSAWDDFCEALRTAGGIVARQAPEGNHGDLVEGFRYLTRIVQMVSGRSIERRTPGRSPQPIRLIPPPRYGGHAVQSPNQDHIVVPVDPRYRYRVTGRTGNVYTHLSAWSPPIPKNAGAFEVDTQAEAMLETFNPNRAHTPHSFVLSELSPDNDHIDFVLSVDDPGDGEVWFPMTPQTRELMGRVVYEDRNTQSPPWLAIVCLDAHKQPLVPEPDDMAERLAIAGQMMVGIVSDYGRWTEDLRSRPNQLQLTPEVYESIGGSPDDRHFEFGYWQLESGKALVVEFDEPACQHWNFQLCNHWMENLAGYANGRGFIDNQYAQVDTNGKVRIVVADSSDDLDVDNLVSPCGHDHGVMGLRFVQPVTPPLVSVSLVPLESLDNESR